MSLLNKLHHSLYLCTASGESSIQFVQHKQFFLSHQDKVLCVLGKVLSMKIKGEEKIEKMQNGEKIKCTRCEHGYVSAVGDPKTTNVFQCDSCETAMVLTVPMKRK